MRWAALAVLLGVAGLGLAAAALDREGLLARPADRADAIVVLGCGVEDDGTPTPCLAARTDAAVALFLEGRAPKLVLTGGKGSGPVAEAGVAAARAHAQGVPTEALVVEGRSTSTAENAAFAAQLQPAGRLILVTDTYHVGRASRCFAATGNTVSALPVIEPAPRRAIASLREVFATVWYAVSGKCRSQTADGQNRPPSAPP